MRLAILTLVFEDFMLPCFTKQLFGFDCPGCGLQRSIAFLIQGDFIAAFKMYPAIYPIMALSGFLLLDHFQKIKYSSMITSFLMVTTVAFILGNYILKFI
ncbi:DUF2752 domain-containing protein [Pareuzebyella sediminis]|uniref:DUF2752 domain-containing protein n=1 Tax=Pareuzebyella sediminis TaxID=2607998 RepID=UPI0011ECF7C3|nr:DUF2752 domain-containing protein [Pareuzebyella sediminis]